MPIQPRMSLQTVAFNPTPFQAVTFTPQSADTSILAHSFDTIAQREKETSEKLGAMDATFSQLRTKVHQDPETLKWFEDFTNQQKTKVKNYVNNYDFAGAINKANELAGEVLNNGELQGRIHANEEYQKLVTSLDEKLKSKAIKQPTYDWWMATHKYQYKDLTDDSGNIVGGDLDIDKSLPVDDINWASHAMAAFKIISPDKGGSQRGGSVQVSNTTTEELTRGKHTYKPGETISSSWQSGSNREKVAKKDIIARMEELLSATPDGYRQAEQAFNVAMFDFQKLVDDYNTENEEDPTSDKAKNLAQQIEAREKIFYKNNALIDYKEYYARMITNSLYADGLAYNWVTTNSNSTSGYGLQDMTPSPSTPGYGRLTSKTPKVGYTYDATTGEWLGPLVRMDTNYDGTVSAVADDADAIGNAFNEPK